MILIRIKIALSTESRHRRVPVRETLKSFFGSTKLSANCLRCVFVAVICIPSWHLSGEISQQLINKYRAPISDWPEFTVDPSVQAQELSPLPQLPVVPWHTPETETLGKQLFFDPRLSGSGQIACASCHDPNLGWTDGKRVSFGHDRQRGSRNAMTLLNVAYFNELFWDGRAKGLLDLIAQPIQNPIEMNESIDSVTIRLARSEEYKAAFKNAFGSSGITPERIAQAIASFLRTIVSSRSRFDRFAMGNYEVMTDIEIAGMHLFRTKARCMNCHHGPLLSDGKFHHTGLSYFERRFEDLGRFHVTGDKDDRGRFKTPSLRDVKFTGPWMHNGLFTNFDGVLRLYNHGVTFNSRVQKKPNAPPLSPLIRPLGMSKTEIASLDAFLNALGRIPRFVEAPMPFSMNYISNTHTSDVSSDTIQPQ